MTRKVMKKKELSEDQEQTLLATWLDKQKIRYFAIPNGGSRHMLEAIKLKRTGVKKGVPDLFIPLPLKSYHGLFIELKKTTGKGPTEEQEEWITFLQEIGYYAKIAYGFEAAKKIILDYLSFDNQAA